MAVAVTAVVGGLGAAMATEAAEEEMATAGAEALEASAVEAVAKALVEKGLAAVGVVVVEVERATAVAADSRATSLVGLGNRRHK